MITRNEIERRVNEGVFDDYDYESDTLDVAVPLIESINAIITKESGCNLECMIYDYGINGDGEIYLPNLQYFIEEVAERSVRDCIEQHEFKTFEK